MTSLGADGQSLQHSGCKFLKSIKFEANLTPAMDFPSFALFSVTYLDLYLQLLQSAKRNKLANKL